MANVIALDSGALIKLSEGDPFVLAVLRKWNAEGWDTVVPAPVLAETLRGGSADARIHRVLSSRAWAVSVAPVSARDARDAGERLGRAGMSPVHTIDALIVASAIASGAEHMLTGDAGDIGALAGNDLKVGAI